MTLANGDNNVKVIAAAAAVGFALGGGGGTLLSGALSTDRSGEVIIGKIDLTNERLADLNKKMDSQAAAVDDLRQRVAGTESTLIYHARANEKITEALDEQRKRLDAIERGRP